MLYEGCAAVRATLYVTPALRTLIGLKAAFLLVLNLGNQKLTFICSIS